MTPVWRIAVLYLLSALANPSAAQSSVRPWSARTSAELQLITWYALSPNRRLAAVVYTRGELNADSETGFIDIVDIAASRQGRHVVATFISRNSTRDSLAIEDAVWLPSSEGVTFRALDESEKYQAFELAADGQVIQLTHSDSDVIKYADIGAATLFATSAVQTPPQLAYPGEFYRRGEFGNLEGPPDQIHPRALPLSFRLGFSPRGRLPQFTDLSPLEIIRSFDFVMSPDGRHAIFVAFDRFAAQTSFYEFDMETGHSRRLALIGPSDHLGLGAYWSADSRAVLLMGAREASADQSALIVFDTLSASSTLIAPFQDARGPVVRVQTKHNGNSIIVTRASSSGLVSNDAFGFEGARLVRSDQFAQMEADDADGVLLTLREGANRPPAVWTTVNNDHVAISPTDPALERIELQQQRPYRWRDFNGAVSVGGLTLPRGRRLHRLPLIIQAYYYNADRFEPDGPHRGTSDAAQSLAARGFAVLQIDTGGLGQGGQAEGENFVARVDAAISSLAAEGIVDDNRVGLTGFSRAGYEVYYAVTHPGRHNFRAVVVADAFKGSYDEYLTWAATDPSDMQSTPRWFASVSDSSFWNDRDEWFAQETTFNVDRVRVPVLFTLNGASVSASEVLPTIGAFRLTRRPFEVLLFPRGEHLLRHPQERVLLTNAVVDWLSFWLLAYEDSSPAKVEQYRRWRTVQAAWLRQQQWEVSGGLIGTIPPASFPSDSESPPRPAVTR
jgi:dipeptidyl aminopeptidase/acylaminoacyl peptidase